MYTKLNLKRTLTAILFFFALYGASFDLALATPAQVILLRHAEKPEIGPELSELGQIRARALPRLLTTRPELLKFGPPTALYSMAAKHPGSSIRSIQTLVYVSRELKIPIQQKYNTDQIDELIADVLNNPLNQGKNIVICWNHDGLPEIAKKLGVNNAPLKWPGKVYDKIWIITAGNTRTSSKLEVLSQNI